MMEVHNDTEKDTSVQCPSCIKTYASRDSLRKHLSAGRCKGPSKTKPPMDLLKIVANMNDTILSMKEEMSTLKNRSFSHVTNNNITNNDNQNLNVICLREQDDLLAILTSQEKCPKKALAFVKDCALARLAGDCRLLQRVYFPVGEKPAITYGNKSKTLFVYFNGNNERVTEKDWKVIAKIMVNNLQRCYFKGSCVFKDSDCQFIKVKADHMLIPVIDESDLDQWNEHAIALNDEKNQKKIMSNLTIPYESEFL